MKIARDWKDYSVIATGDGYKLERWKDVYLLRPDPQAIWHAQTDMFAYPKLNAYYKRSEKGGGGWTILKPFPPEWNISYDKLGLTFKIKPMGFKHTGLFPEQAVNWETMHELISRRKAAGKPPTRHRCRQSMFRPTTARRSAGSSVRNSTESTRLNRITIWKFPHREWTEHCLEIRTLCVLRARS